MRLLVILLVMCDISGLIVVSMILGVLYWLFCGVNIGVISVWV